MFKQSHDLIVGDKLYAGGIKCTIEKVDNVFHHTPNAFIRLELSYEEMYRKRDRIVIFFPIGLRVKLIK